MVESNREQTQRNKPTLPAPSAASAAAHTILMPWWRGTLDGITADREWLHEDSERAAGGNRQGSSYADRGCCRYVDRSAILRLERAKNEAGWSKRNG